MTNYGEDGAEPFADMTINIPAYSLEPHEAIISGDISKDLLQFIKDNKLGKKLPYEVKSGYGKYAVVAFDLDKLKEFDPKGIEEFKKLHNIAYAMQYCGNLNPIDMVQLVSKCESCHFNMDKSIEFHFPNHYGLKIGYFESTGEWEIVGLKRELGIWEKQKTLITNEYSKLEKNIE